MSGFSARQNDHSVVYVWVLVKNDVQCLCLYVYSLFRLYYVFGFSALTDTICGVNQLSWFSCIVFLHPTTLSDRIVRVISYESLFWSRKATSTRACRASIVSWKYASQLLRFGIHRSYNPHLSMWNTSILSVACKYDFFNAPLCFISFQKDLFIEIFSLLGI